MQLPLCPNAASSWSIERRLYSQASHCGDRIRFLTGMGWEWDWKSLLCTLRWKQLVEKNMPPRGGHSSSLPCTSISLNIYQFFRPNTWFSLLDLDTTVKNIFLSKPKWKKKPHTLFQSRRQSIPTFRPRWWKSIPMTKTTRNHNHPLPRHMAGKIITKNKTNCKSQPNDSFFLFQLC